MCSTPDRAVRIALTLAAGLLLAAGGCQSAHGPEPTRVLVESTKSPESRPPVLKWTPVASGQHLDPVQPDPPEDVASLARHWESSASFYQSGAAVAYPNYKLDKDLLPPPLRGPIKDAFADPLLFLAQTVATPFWMIVVPPWTQVVYRGAYFGPTQTAAAPLPPE